MLAHAPAGLDSERGIPARNCYIARGDAQACRAGRGDARSVALQDAEGSITEELAIDLNVDRVAAWTRQWEARQGHDDVDVLVPAGRQALVSLDAHAALDLAYLGAVLVDGRDRESVLLAGLCLVEEQPDDESPLHNREDLVRGALDGRLNSDCVPARPDHVEQSVAVLGVIRKGHPVEPHEIPPGSDSSRDLIQPVSMLMVSSRTAGSACAVARIMSASSPG